MKSRYFNDCREMLDKNSILEPSDSGIFIERFRALNWEKILWLRISSVHDVIVQSTVCPSLVFQLQKLNKWPAVCIRIRRCRLSQSILPVTVCPTVKPAEGSKEWRILSPSFEVSTTFVPSKTPVSQETPPLLG